MAWGVCTELLKHGWGSGPGVGSCSGAFAIATGVRESAGGLLEGSAGTQERKVESFWRLQS